MKILSIDPGKSGAIALSDYSNGLLNVEIELHKTPMLKNDKDYNIRSINEIFSEEYDFIVLEDVHSIHGSSANSNFQFGLGVGIMRTLAENSNRPYFLVSPMTWQKVAWEGIKKVKNPKINSSVAVHRLFPHVNFIPPRGKVPHDGMIDAVLLGYYGYVKHGNKK